jgi:Papain family cysteine protease
MWWFVLLACIAARGSALERGLLAAVVPYPEDLAAFDHAAHWTEYKALCGVAPASLQEEAGFRASLAENLRRAAAHNAVTRAAERSGALPAGSERLGANCEAHWSHAEWRARRGLAQRGAWLADHPEPRVAPPVQSWEASRPPLLHRAVPAGPARGRCIIEFLREKNQVSRSGLASKTCSSSTSSCDWRGKTGVVGAVQDQGVCGSCWAFAGSEVVRSCNVISYGPTSMPNLSAEQLLDCSQPEGNIYNCSAGYVQGGMQYVIDNGGVNSAPNYPYVAGVTGDPSPCNGSLTGTHVATATQVRYVNENSPSSMISCAYNQPIAVNLAGGAPIFQLYVTGIISNATACGTTVDHTILLVGWGTSGSTHYWIARNQWGTGWGQAGDVQILRDTANGGIGVCAVNSFPTFAYC